MGYRVKEIEFENGQIKYYPERRGIQTLFLWRKLISVGEFGSWGHYWFWDKEDAWDFIAKRIEDQRSNTPVAQTVHNMEKVE
jgi:phage pi2 protein 07